MDKIDDNVIEVLQSVIMGNPSKAKKKVSREQLIEFLVRADGDPNKALDYYYQNIRNPYSDLPEALDARNHKQVHELRDILGGHVQVETLMNLLKRTNNNVHEAVELYFTEGNTLCEEMAVSNDAMQKPSPLIEEDTKQTGLLPIASHYLKPLTSPLNKIARLSAEDDDCYEAPCVGTTDSGVYEISISEKGVLGWEIGNIFGRLVVQNVEPKGVAGRAGVLKADVLISVNDIVVDRLNAAELQNELSREVVLIPSILRLRRPQDIHHVDGSSERPLQPHSICESRLSDSCVEIKTTDTAVKSDTLSTCDVVNVSLADSDKLEIQASETPSMSYGLTHLEQVAGIIGATIDDQSANMQSILEVLLMADLNTDVALNNYFDEHRTVPDFRHIIGYDWDPSCPEKCTKGVIYEAVIPVGPLGLTVENILERTVVVDIKPTGAAAKAGVKRSSWLVGLNNEYITNLTHKEALSRIERAERPLHLKLIVISASDYKSLRKQLCMNIRQPKTERPVPEQDRMSFRVFQAKIHQAILHFPMEFCCGIFRYLTLDDLDNCEQSLSNEDAARDAFLTQILPNSRVESVLKASFDRVQQHGSTRAEMSAERRYLLNLFGTIHSHDDKGESVVIRTIYILGLLGKRIAQLYHQSNCSREESGEASSASLEERRTRYQLLIALILYVLESLAIIENHATWDAMVHCLRELIKAMSDEEVDTMIIPLISKLSTSSSPTARIVPIAILSDVYARTSGDILVQLRGMVDRLALDDNPLVRRAVTSILAQLANVVGSCKLEWIVHLLEKATSDNHDIVRTFAVKSYLQVANILRAVLLEPDTNPQLCEMKRLDPSLRLLYCQMVPLVNSYVCDTSWQVRVEAARMLPSLCLIFGKEYADVFVDHFIGIIRDPTMEVRKACVEIAYDMAESMIKLNSGNITASVSTTEDDQKMDTEEHESSTGEVVGRMVHQVAQLELQNDSAAEGNPRELIVATQNKIVRSILPATYGLATDASVIVRLALARFVGKSLSLIGEQHYEDLVPIFTQCLDESQDSSVRAALLEETTRNCNKSAELLLSLSFPVLRKLIHSPSWRIRVQSIHCIAAWANRADSCAFPSDFATNYLGFLEDPIHEVRWACCNDLVNLVNCLGNEWLVSDVLKAIMNSMQSTFNGKLTGLCAIEKLAVKLHKVGKLDDVIKVVMEECNSRTPNLRFRALRTLNLLVQELKDDALTNHVLNVVSSLASVEQESDPDVRDTAVHVLSYLKWSKL